MAKFRALDVTGRRFPSEAGPTEHSVCVTKPESNRKKIKRKKKGKMLLARSSFSRNPRVMRGPLRTSRSVGAFQVDYFDLTHSVYARTAQMQQGVCCWWREKCIFGAKPL